MADRMLSQEEKFQIVAQALQTPQGRVRIGQTMDSNVAPNSNVRMKSPLYAGKSENSPLLSNKESKNVRDADNQQGRIDTVKCLLCGFEGKSLEGHLYCKHKINCKKYRDECLVVWGNELKNIEEVKKKIFRYLFPSETIRGQSSVKEDYDIVRTTQRCVEVGRNSYPPEEILVSTCLY